MVVFFKLLPSLDPPLSFGLAVFVLVFAASPFDESDLDLVFVSVDVDFDLVDLVFSAEGGEATFCCVVLSLPVALGVSVCLDLVGVASLADFVPVAFPFVDFVGLSEAGFVFESLDLVGCFEFDAESLLDFGLSADSGVFFVVSTPT